MIVVDASAALAWILPRQTTPAALALRASGGDFAAPDVFQIELRNVLLKAERRGLITDAEADRTLTDFQALVRISGAADLDAVFRLARAQRLSFFDGCYLDLGIRESASLASRDGSLLEAAQRCGVAVHDLR